MSHSGAILCLNCLSYGSNPNKTKEEEHQAVFNAYQQARSMGAQPGAIVLQDYEWASDSGLNILASFLNGATGTQTWKAVRQFGESKMDLQEAANESTSSLRDAVILYDRSVYIGTAIEKSTIGAFRDHEDLLAGMQDNIKAQLTGFIGRWAGVELEVVDAATGKSSDLTFMLVSYHGRKIIRANDDILPVQTSVKAAMAKDFIAQAADCAIGEEHIPVMIAGSWNIDSAPISANGGVKSPADSKAPWNTSVHLSADIQKDAVGQPVNPVDYAVAVHPADGSNTSTDLKIKEVCVLEHPAAIASHFQHKPLLFKIEVAPRA